MGRSDFLLPVPGGSLTRPPVPSSCSFCSLPLPASTTHNGPGCWSPGFPNRVFRHGDNRISRVPGRSPRYMPCSHQTPAGPERQAIQRPRCCLPLLTRRRLPQFGFRGSITRPASSLSTLRSPGYPGNHARLASGRWPTLPRRDSTRRICSEGFRNDSSHVISSPFPELCSAHARLRSHGAATGFGGTLLRRWPIP